MSITPVPISIRLVRAPMAASSGNGLDSWRAKWCTRKYAPSAPSSSAATARSMDCSSASEAERVFECGDGDQWPNDRNPMCFMAPSCRPPQPTAGKGCSRALSQVSLGPQPERQVGDAGRRGDGLDVVGILEALQAVPDADAATEHDRDLDEMHVVDEPRGDEVAYDGGAAADPDVLTVGCLAGSLQRLGRGDVEEVERGAAVHLDRRPRSVGEDEGRRVEGRVVAPPAAPVRVVLPAGRAELVGAHDLGADPGAVALGEGVVDTGGAGRVPEAGREHPLVQALARMAERCLGGLRLTRGEAVEGDGQVVDPGQ